jgi:hypothetical protein
MPGPGKGYSLVDGTCNAKSNHGLSKRRAAGRGEREPLVGGLSDNGLSFYRYGRGDTYSESGNSYLVLDLKRRLLLFNVVSLSRAVEPLSETYADRQRSHDGRLAEEKDNREANLRWNSRPTMHLPVVSRCPRYRTPTACSSTDEASSVDDSDVEHLGTE